MAGIALAHILTLYEALVPVRFFLPMHLILEFSSIVVSFAVFTTGWFGYKQTQNFRDLIVGVTFLTTGTMDFIHTLSYKGMPDFLSTNTTGTAAAYWIVARLIVGAGLLWAAYVQPRAKTRWLSPGRLVAGAVVVLAAFTTIISYYAAVGSMLFSRHLGGLTPLKIGLEYLAIIIYGAVFFSLSEKRGWDERVIVGLRSALLFAIFAEMSFTLYTSPYSPINALGHIFKTAAYYMILSSLFVSALQRPYEQLSRTRDELQELYADAQEHRKEIERSFSRIGSALSSSLNIDDALNRISELAADMLHADCSIVAAMDKRGGQVRVAAQKGGCHEVGRPVDLTLRVAKQAARERKSVLINDIESTGWVQCDFKHPTCLRAMICAPMIYEEDVLGVITIYSHTREAFNEGDVKLLEAFAAHASVAVHNAISYERESHIADVLQRSFLAGAGAVTGRFQIAQVYEPAMTEALVGGDFYDIIEMPDDKIGLVIGDVSGKGLSAAVHTAMVKYSLRAFVSEGHSPAEVMRRLDKAVTEFTDFDTFVTMFFGVLDLNTGELVYTNAGHEPPVYSCNSTYMTLSSTGPALGFDVDLDFEEGRLVLEKGCTLLLYTDGISEARKGNVLLGTERIGEQLVTCGDLSSEDVAKCVHRAAVDFAGGELRDDAAILAVRTLE